MQLLIGDRALERLVFSYPHSRQGEITLCPASSALPASDFSSSVIRRLTQPYSCEAPAMPGTHPSCEAHLVVALAGRRRATPRLRPPALQSLSGAWQSAAARWRSPGGMDPLVEGVCPADQGQAISALDRCTSAAVAHATPHAQACFAISIWRFDF